MCAVLTPFFKLLMEYTGFRCFTLLCGDAPDVDTEDFPVAAVHFGKTTEQCPRNFQQFNPHAFERILGFFVDFLAATVGK